MLRQGVARVASSMPAMSSSLSAALSSSLAECSTSGRLLPALAARFSAAAAASAAGKDYLGGASRAGRRGRPRLG